MIFIWGSYSRSQMLYEAAMCDRCNKERNIEFRRVWRTGHFFFVPLFSYSHAVFSRCQHCKREGVAYFPRPLPSLPFMDRFGFLFPIGAIAALFLVFGVAVASATTSSAAAAQRPTPPGTSLRLELEKDFGVHAVRDDRVTAVATGVERAIHASYQNVGDVRVAVRLQPRATSEAAGHERAIVLVQLSNLRRAEDDVRRH